ncbi:hypothetical protein V3391_02565 [Luteimonas sp. SMYT11W]|uniref:Lipoprotein n=1 Tax=Luteimonas flava TaxID=3115822 RepID=A0ABU7WDA1_9GAMM
MRTSIIAVIATALVGCAHLSPSLDAGVAIELDAHGCIAAASPDVLIRIRNTSNARVAFYTYGTSGPPYELHPGSVQLLDAVSGEPWQVVLEHFFPATTEVSFGSEDQADFTYEPSVWPSGQETGILKLQIRDTRGRFHYSSELGVCHPGSAPNNSFKPTPLRGAA